jgi:regulator of replication initiation timing
MDQLRSGARRLTRDHAECKEQIRGIESDLARLPSGPGSSPGSSPARNRTPPSRDTSKDELMSRLSSQAANLSAVRLENAQLKKQIAEKEAANVHLIVELQQVRERLETMESISASQQSLSDSIDNLRSDLEDREREVDALKSQLRQYSGIHVHERLVRHEQEVTRAKKEIDRVAHRESDEPPPAEKRVSKQRPPQGSKGPKDGFETLYVSVRDENAALKVELDFLRAKCTELSALLHKERERKVERTFQQEEFDRMRCEVLQLRALSNGPASRSVLADFSTDLQRRLFRWSSSFLLKIDIAESKFATELDHLAIKIGKLKTAYLQVRVLQNQRRAHRGSAPDKRDFLAFVDRGVRSIEAFSRAYAASHDYPEEKVPSAVHLVSNASSLKRFCHRVETHPC